MAKRTGEKYQAILEAAVKVIAENGYHNAQVSRIAREAGVADGTIYLYFENKEDIMISLFKSKMGDFAASGQKELENIKEPYRMLACLIHTHFLRLQSDRNLAAVLQIELRQSDPSIRKSISEIIKAYYSLIEEVVKYGIKKGCFRSDLNPRLARKIIFGSLDEVATCWVLSNRRYRLTDMTVQVYNILARGLSVDGKAAPFPADILPGGREEQK
ncbi:MAG: TetR/AcrR family transcriptional regulator [Bacillota bacterium]